MYSAEEQPSVTTPNVPSAPMNNFVVSNPAEDFLDRLLVFMTSPEGNTTVYFCSAKSGLRWLSNLRHSETILPCLYRIGQHLL